MTEPGLQPNSELFPPEMCQVCFHVHTTSDWCSADDWAPGPEGDEWLGPCTCRVNADAAYVASLRLFECDGSCSNLRTTRHWHARPAEEQLAE
jgi:hypothetical protein